jgi:hypothetical protein
VSECPLTTKLYHSIIFFLSLLFSFCSVHRKVTYGILFFLGFGGLWLLRDWSLNDFFLSEKAERYVKYAFRLGLFGSAVGFMAASDSARQLYAASVFFLVFIGTEWVKVAIRVQAIASTDVSEQASKEKHLLLVLACM